MRYPAIRLLIVLCSLFPAFVPALAQDTTWRYARPNVLKTNVLAPVSLFYELAITRRFAVRTSARWLKLARGVFKQQAFVNATLEGKIYTARLVNLGANDHPAGFFVNPYLKARSMTYSEEVGTGPGNPTARDQIRVNSIGFGLTVGYQWVSRRGFVVEIFNGFGGFPVNNILQPCGTPPSCRGQTTFCNWTCERALIWAMRSDVRPLFINFHQTVHTHACVATTNPRLHPPFYA